MKILHMLTSINTGGAEKFCVDLCNTQSEIHGHDVYLCILDKIEAQPLIKKISKSVSVISLDKEQGYSLKVIFQIYKKLQELNPDIIHLNGRALIYASFSILFKKIPSVYTVHTIADKEYNRFISFYIKLLFNSSNYLFTPVAIGKTVSKSVQSIYGKKFNKYIYNGSSKLFTSSKYYDVRKSIQESKLNDNTLVFLYIGRIQKAKNTFMLVQSFNKLLDEGENVILYIVGYDPVSGGDYLEKCKNENRHPDKILFVGEQKNIADYLDCADACCLTSSYEGLGIVILESFSRGVPVLSTPSGGPSDIIQNGISGYISDEITVESYLKTLKIFIRKPLKNSDIIVSIYKEYYTMEACSKNYLELYNSILK